MDDSLTMERIVAVRERSLGQMSAPGVYLAHPRVWPDLRRVLGVEFPNEAPDCIELRSPLRALLATVYFRESMPSDALYEVYDEGLRAALGGIKRLRIWSECSTPPQPAWAP